MSAAWGGQILCTDAIARARARDLRCGWAAPSPRRRRRRRAPPGHRARPARRFPRAAHARHRADDDPGATLQLRRSRRRHRGGAAAPVGSPARHVDRSRGHGQDPPRDRDRGPGAATTRRRCVLRRSRIARARRPHRRDRSPRACLVALDASRAPLDQLTDALLTRDGARSSSTTASTSSTRPPSCRSAPRRVSGGRRARDQPRAVGAGRGSTSTSSRRSVPARDRTRRRSSCNEPRPRAASCSTAPTPTSPSSARGSTASRSRSSSPRARARTSSPAQTLARLDGHLDVLSGTRRRVPDRHQTLRAAISWSYELLTDRERALFDRLSVFGGSFDLAAAVSVAGTDDDDVADLLHDLVSKSMVEIRYRA